MLETIVLLGLKKIICLAGYLCSYILNAILKHLALQKYCPSWNLNIALVHRIWRFFFFLHCVPQTLLILDIIIKQWFSTSRRSWVNKVNNSWSSCVHFQRTGTQAGDAFEAWKSTHQRYRAELFWCDSIVRSGRLNAVPSQHCSPEALKHFGDKHRLAVKRATEEKAYQMSPQWAVSCIIRPAPQIRWRLEFDAPQQNCVIRLLMELSPPPPAFSESEFLYFSRNGEIYGITTARV